MTRQKRAARRAVTGLLLMMAAACGSPQSTLESTGPAEITFTSDPATPRMGENTFEVMVMQDGRPVDDASVSVELFMPAMPSMNMAEMRTRADLMPVGNGVYRGTGQVMMAGNWDMTVVATREGQQIGSRKLSVTAQ